MNKFRMVVVTRYENLKNLIFLLPAFFLKDTYEGIISGEQELEREIAEGIETKRQKIKLLALELRAEYDDSKFGKNLSKLDEDEVLKKELHRLEAEKTRRIDDYKKLAVIEKEFCDKLDLKRTILTHVPSEFEMINLRNRIKELEKTCAERKKEIAKIKENIESFCEELDLSHSDSFTEMVLFESIDIVPLSDEHMKRAHEVLDGMKTRDKELSVEIKNLRSKIIELWTKLSIENPEMRELVIDKNSKSVLKDYGMTKKALIEQLHHEYERCVQIKMENMQKFIESIRVEVRQLCDQLFLGKNEMSQMEAKFLKSTDFTEALLTEHEEALEDLKFRYTESQALYEKTAKWIELWNEFIAFEEKTKDPQRFKIRGYNMLEEEKSRKAFQTQLPKLEDEIQKLASDYESMNGGQEYTVFGLSMTEFMHRKKLDYEESKMNERKEKQMIKENMKRNESKYGSKPITPLALRNKRKVSAHQDTHLQTPGGPKSKLQKTELATPSTSSRNVTQNTIKAKPSAASTLTTKSKIAAKRKSKTPRGRSRILNNQSKMQQQQDDADVTIKTTTTGSILSSMTTSSYQSSMMSSHGHSNLHNGSTNSTHSNSGARALTAKPSTTSSTKCPPLSASSKYSSQMAPSKGFNTNTQHPLTRMTSTASNTFIEEDGENMIDDYENPNVVVTAAAHKISSLVSNSASTASRFGFQFQSQALESTKFSQKDVNYNEFMVMSSSIIIWSQTYLIC